MSHVNTAIPNETQVDGRLALRRMTVKSLDKRVASGPFLVTGDKWRQIKKVVSPWNPFLHSCEMRDNDRAVGSFPHDSRRQPINSFAGDSVGNERDNFVLCDLQIEASRQNLSLVPIHQHKQEHELSVNLDPYSVHAPEKIPFPWLVQQHVGRFNERPMRHSLERMAEAVCLQDLGNLDFPNENLRGFLQVVRETPTTPIGPFLRQSDHALFFERRDFVAATAATVGGTQVASLPAIVRSGMDLQMLAARCQSLALCLGQIPAVQRAF